MVADVIEEDINPKTLNTFFFSLYIMKTSEPITKFRYKAEIPQEEISAEEIVQFIRLNQYQSKWAQYKQFIDELKYYLFCYGCEDSGAIADAYHTMVYMYSPSLNKMYYFGVFATYADNNDDGSFDGSMQADKDIIKTAREWINGLRPELSVKADQVVQMVSCHTWYVGFVQDAKAWPNNTYYRYAKLIHEWLKTYELDMRQDDKSKIYYDSNYESVTFPATAYRVRYWELKDYFEIFKGLKSKVRDEVEEVRISRNILMPIEAIAEIPQIQIIQPERGNYPERPEYIGEIGFTYQPQTYMGFSGCIGLILPSNFEVDEQATRTWWSRGGTLEKWNPRMNFVLLKMHNADDVPLITGDAINYSVFPNKKGTFDYNMWGSNKKQGLKTGDKYVHMRNKFFIYPIAENFSFELGQDALKDVFPPMIKYATSALYTYGKAFNRRKQIHHPDKREWEFYHFYEIFPNRDVLNQTDYILERLDTRANIVKGVSIAASLLMIAFRLKKVFYGDLKVFGKYRKSRWEKLY